MNNPPSQLNARRYGDAILNILRIHATDIHLSRERHDQNGIYVLVDTECSPQADYRRWSGRRKVFDHLSSPWTLYLTFIGDINGLQFTSQEDGEYASPAYREKKGVTPERSPCKRKRWNFICCKIYKKVGGSLQKRGLSLHREWSPT